VSRLDVRPDETGRPWRNSLLGHRADRLGEEQGIDADARTTGVHTAGVRAVEAGPAEKKLRGA
jgi:hypothetical protein